MSDTTVTINTLYWPNTDPDIVKAHSDVMNHFDLPVGYTVHQMPHGMWMDAVMEQSTSDIVCFFDIDCVPTNKEVIDAAVAYVQRTQSFIGISQVSNHIKPCSHIFAAPAFFMIWRETWNKMLKPTFAEQVKCDVGENVSYIAEMMGLKFKTLFPTHYYRQPENERWYLHSYGEYGIGTHFEGGIFHLYQGRHPQNQQLFKEVCASIIDGTFTTDGMKDSREF